jgi:hypothetical protein
MPSVGDVVGVAVGVGVGVGVTVSVGAGVGVGVGVGAVLGPGEEGGDAVGGGSVAADVRPQLPGAGAPLPDEVPPVARPSGDELPAADGAASGLFPPRFPDAPAPAEDEGPPVAVPPLPGAAGQDGGTVVPPPLAAVPDGTAVALAPGPVPGGLLAVPLIEPAGPAPPPTRSGLPPKVGASTWPPPVSMLEPTSTKAVRSGGTARVIVVTDAAAASPATRRIQVWRCGRAADRGGDGP